MLAGLDLVGAGLGADGVDVTALWERYFEELAVAAASGRFDVMAHPDLIKKFAFRPSADLKPVYEHTAAALARAGVAIEVKIKAQLVATKDVKSINYRWRSVAGIVYLIGSAQNSEELSSVIEVIRRIEGVKRVVNYARVRGA